MRREFEDREHWHKRWRLPHYDGVKKYQMITYGLADSWPARHGDELKAVERGSLECRKMMEEFYDKGYGACLLKRDDCANLVFDAWKFFDGERYDLLAYVVMPSHVHLLIKTYEEFSLESVIHSWKSFTAHEMLKILGEERRLKEDETSTLPGIWQRQYWDRFIRDEKHFHRAISYIHENPVKAGLCENAEDWKWSSANVIN